MSDDPTQSIRPFTLRDWEVRGLLGGTIAQIRRPVRWGPVEAGLPGNFLHDFSRAHVDPGFPEPDGVHRYQYLKVPFAHPDDGWAADNPGNPGPDTVQRVYCEDAPGDLVWCRERFASNRTHDGPTFVYAADDEDTWRTLGCHWHPANRMKRHASRLTLEILSVRPERLHDLTREDAVRSGAPEAIRRIRPDRKPSRSPRSDFVEMWDRDYRKSPHRFIENPWAWVREVRVVPQAEVTAR